jgi:hypothetical protein
MNYERRDAAQPHLVIASEAKQSSFTNILDCFGLCPRNDELGLHRAVHSS